MSQPKILVSDVDGITAADLSRVRQNCQQSGHPLLLVTPGVHSSVLGQLGDDLIAVKATDLSDQPLRNLLEDVAIVTGATVLLRELGFGLTFPDSLVSLAQGGVFIPRESWQDLSPHAIGSANRVTIDAAGTTLYCTPQARQLRGRTETLLRQASLPGREARLRRLGVAAPARPIEAEAASSPVRDEPLTFRLGLASPYFITDPQAGVCRLEDARVAVFAKALTDLPMLVQLLGTAARSGQPLLLVAPSASAEALALCVTNKLRGILHCAVAVPPDPGPDAAQRLTDVARGIGAPMVAQGDVRWDTLGRARRICLTSDECGLTPAEDRAGGRSERSARVPPGPSVTAMIQLENRFVQLEFAETVWHLSGEFAGNFDLSVRATDPLPAEDVLENLRVRMPGGKKLLSVAGHCQIPGGWQVTVYSEWAPTGRAPAASDAPVTADVFWLNHSRREPLVQVPVTHVLDDD